MSTQQPAPESGEAGTGAYLATLPTVVREWGRIGCIGFGGPPAHIALLRQLCVDRKGWLDAAEFEDAIAACNLLPGPASTELAIFCGWRVRGRLGALAGGAAFIIPGLILILALSALFLATAPPAWIRGAGAGAGSAVAAVAIQAGWSLAGPSWRRASRGPASRGPVPSGPVSSASVPSASVPSASVSSGQVNGHASHQVRWVIYLLGGAIAAAAIGPWLVLVLLGCGLIELSIRQLGDRRASGPRHGRPHEGGPDDSQPAPPRAILLAPLLAKTAAGTAAGAAVFGAIAWVAFKVGALSFGGGFVIIPLMQADAVGRTWMTNAQFLNAVALGQITPGPVVQTVAAVGYAAAGLPGGLLAAVVAFIPSFLFILCGARYFQAIRSNPRPQAFLDGAGPAAIGAIFGSAYLLAGALSQPWQYAILAAAVLLLLVVKRGVVLTLLCAAAAGLIIVVSGGLPP